MNESPQSTQSSVLSSEQKISTAQDLAQLVDQIAILLQDADQVDKREYEALYAAFYRNKNKVESSLDAEGKELVLLQEARLNDLNQQFRKIERERNEVLAAKQIENGTKVEALLNELESLLDESIDFKVIYDGFHRIREGWESLRPLTQQDESSLGKKFVALRDAFYDLKHINEELRDYDFRKNLEAKQALLEEMRTLEQSEDILDAVRKLDVLVARWRDVGPVSRDNRAEIAQAYKTLTTSIYKRHQAYHDGVKEEETQNAQRKEELVARVQAYLQELPKSVAQWTTKTDEIKALQEEWRNIGRASKKSNTDLYLRFREVCDQFFVAKQEFFKERKQTQSEAISQRKALIEKANEVANGRSYVETAEALKALQEEWKRLPHLRKEEGDALWSEFRKPFDAFFQRKREHDRKQHGIEHHNELRKKSLLSELKAFVDQEEIPSNLKEKLTAIKENWKKIGRAGETINDKLWEEFCALNDVLYERLRKLSNQRRGEQVKARYKKLSEQPQGVQSELQFLQRKAERLRGELRNYDNNISFLSAGSKGGANPLIAEVERKRARLAQDLQHVEEELNMLRSMESNN